MRSLFISYRRDDTGEFARTLYAELRQRYGASRVFIDTEDLRGGERWAAAIDDALDSAAVVIVLIGADWTTLERDGRCRLHHEDDWVRREVVRGLDASRRLIPVLYTRRNCAPTKPPAKEQLPSEMHALPETQCVSIHQASTTRDIKALFARIDRTIWPRRTWLAMAVALVAMTLALGVALRPERRTLRKDTSGLVLERPPKQAALWAPAGDPRRGLVQSDPDGAVYVWHDAEVSAGLSVERISASDAEVLLGDLIAPKKTKCGTLLRRIGLLRAVLPSHAALFEACHEVATRCVPNFESSPPEIMRPFADAYERECSP